MPSVACIQDSKKKRYHTLALVALSHAANHAYSALMPIVYPPIMAEFGFGYAQLGFVMGIGNTLASLVQGIYAFLIHRVLRRVLLAAGNIVLGLSVMLIPLFGGFIPFLCLNVIAKLGTSPQHPVGNSLVVENFGQELRGTAFALNFAGANAGTLLIPVLGTAGVSFLGWRATLIIFAIITVLIGISALSIPEVGPAGVQQTGKGGKVWNSGRSWLAPLYDRNIWLGEYGLWPWVW